MNISLKYISNTSALSSVCKCSFSLWHFWLKQAAVFSEKAFKNPLCKQNSDWLVNIVKHAAANEPHAYLGAEGE